MATSKVSLLGLLAKIDCWNFVQEIFCSLEQLFKKTLGAALACGLLDYRKQKLLKTIRSW